MSNMAPGSKDLCYLCWPSPELKLFHEKGPRQAKYPLSSYRVLQQCLCQGGCIEDPTRDLHGIHRRTLSILLAGRNGTGTWRRFAGSVTDIMLQVLSMLLHIHSAASSRQTITKLNINLRRAPIIRLRQQATLRAWILFSRAWNLINRRRTTRCLLIL